MALLSFLDRELSVAHPGYSRWLVPPAALAIHLSIGQAYAFSVFKIPLTQLLGVGKSMPDDWKQTQIAWIFSLAIVMLGLSAATFGKWLEGAGPRKAMFASAVCFAFGFYISYLGVISHQLWLLYVGYGVVGGIGLGLGYISPVSTLIKWFPDRPGLATGMAIMGFGGGAMIGSPLAIKLMAYFRSSTDVGVGKTFLVMGTLYLMFMMFGVFTIRVPQGRMEAGKLDSASKAGCDDYDPQCRCEHRIWDAPILASLDRIVRQCYRRYRHHRTSLADDSGIVQGEYRSGCRGRFCGPAQSV